MLVVGAASRDLVADDPRGWRLGGAVTYASLTLARLGVPVRALIGVDAAAARAPELDVLRRAGVEVDLAPLERIPVLVNEERPEGRVQRCVEASSPLDPDALPVTWRPAAALFLGPIAGELGPAWASVAAPDAPVALGWQGLLRRLVPSHVVERRRPEGGPLLDRADLVGLSVDDIGSDMRLARLVDLVRPGATLVVTRGAGGGTALTSHRPARSSLWVYPAIPSDGALDPTGAGDVFLAALFATIVSEAPLTEPSWPSRLAFAAAAGSLAVEGPGITAVPTLAAVRRRVAEAA